VPSLTKQVLSAFAARQQLWARSLVVQAQKQPQSVDNSKHVTERRSATPISAAQVLRKSKRKSPEDSPITPATPATPVETEEEKPSKYIRLRLPA